MFRIKTFNAIAPEGLKRFEQGRYIMNENEGDEDAWVLRSHNVHEESIPKTLLAVARAGAGVNNIPLDRLAHEGVVVFHTPGANANAVKELVLASLLLSVRPILRGARWLEEHRADEQLERKVEAEKKQFVGTELRGKTVGIIGLGAIGATLANDLLQLGVDVIGYDPYLSVDGAWNISQNVRRAKELHEILPYADYVTLHVPLTEQTRHSVDSYWFKQMKPGATLLNFARGELIEPSALREALDHKLSLHITDFPNKELLEHPRVLALPHLGASTVESEVNCAVQAVDTLKYFLETGNIRGSANYPNTELPYIGKRRITVLHRNVPNMVGQIAGTLAACEINIDNMINRSRGEVAYTIIDIDNHRDEVLPLSDLYEIAGIMRVRDL